ncbi:MAG: type II toxin-antitoxin system Phd/YefM family antitoxin [Chloroflexi bacterium]|nr:type II toxin-antitoxin system Phd/YefM family antitoxin [Chloroflexota bacterium]
MKVVNVTTIRQDATKVLREAKESGEPVLVVQRSRPAAYVIDASQFDAMQAELKALRREAFLREVAEAEEEIRQGKARAYDSVDELMADLGK